MYKYLKIIRSVWIIFVLVVAAACTGTIVSEPRPVYAPANGHGPPPWAPAHGYRAKHHYYYYPGTHVYFDVGRSLYFYHDGGRWRTSARLPVGISINFNEYVTLDMDTDRPYKYHGEVVKRYPPGQAKKLHGKSKNKKHW